jgi:outer membrane protein assembly factor BamA
MYRSIISVAIAGLPAAIGLAAELPDGDMLETDGYVIGSISLDRADIFDLSNPEENRWLYRAANRYHIITLEKTVAKQLLFDPGDPFDRRKIEESERILRANKYLFDAQIRPVHVADGQVDLQVSTRDVWSLTPELSYSRKGGETRTRIGLEEFNLLGRGQRLRYIRDNDIDRTENTIEFADRHIGSNWVSLVARYSDNSDGRSKLLSVVRPFYALDTRWAAGTSFFSEERQDKLYQYGEAAAEYRQERDYAMVFGGLSSGLRNGKARRWTAGMVSDTNSFSAPIDTTLPASVPADRKLVYPFLAFELVEDRFVTSKNQDQMDRTEDFQMGLQVRASLGWSDTTLGADRDAAVFSASLSNGFGSLSQTALLLSMRTSGRVEASELANAILSLQARFYHRQSERRSFFAELSGTLGESLDLDNPVEIGGDSGLRGYPLRYQAGESKVLATIEQRYYTDWYPFRLFRVGGAIFADAGRVWGENPLGPDRREWLTDVGFGLRLAVTRVTTKVIHIDLAFPLSDDSDIDSVQLLVEIKNSF